MEKKRLSEKWVLRTMAEACGRCKNLAKGLPYQAEEKLWDQLDGLFEGCMEVDWMETFFNRLEEELKGFAERR